MRPGIRFLRQLLVTTPCNDLQIPLNVLLLVLEVLLRSELRVKVPLNDFDSAPPGGIFPGYARSARLERVPSHSALLAGRCIAQLVHGQLRWCRLVRSVLFYQHAGQIVRLLVGVGLVPIAAAVQV